MKKLLLIKGGGEFPLLSKKLIRVMKLSTFLIFVSMLQIFADGLGQGTTVTLKAYNTNLPSIFQEIEEQTDFRFVYKSEDVNSFTNVTLRAKENNINQILDQVLEDTGLKYRVLEDRLIVITPANFNQEIAVKGKITDIEGNPLPGVNIVEKGTTNGAVTNLEGEYTINVSNSNSVIVFSYVGFLTEEIILEGQTKLDLTMLEDIQSLEEVVVVGYGIQKRENVTGSLETANSEQILNKPIVNLAQALQGELSGLSIRQPNGEPGSSTQIRIRGYGTFSSAGNDPLVLVDGIPGSIDAINPNDIDNISVLKDAASAAIYGSRAANGVILIQTKRGQAGKTDIVYSGTFGFSELADSPEFVDSWNYALAYNEALRNAGQGEVYTEEDIENFRQGTDPDKYPNDKHYQMAFDNIAYQTKHDLTLSGGNENNRYLFSLGYLRNDGLLQNNLYDNYSDNLLNYYNKYSARLNVDSDLSKKLRLIANFSGTASDEKGPAAATGNRTTQRVVTRITRLPSAIAARTTDGYYGRVDKGAPWADIDATSHELDRNYYFIGNVNLEYKILEPLKVVLTSGYVFDNTNYRLYAADEQIDATTYAGPAKLDVNWNTRRELTLEGLIKYEQTFENHSISAMAGYSQIESKYDFLTAYRDQFPTNELFELNVGSSENQRNSGGASEWGLLSYFGRAQYSYLGKYLVEANVRYDGSSRFGEGNRFGLFPSFSAGWRISEEKFIKENVSWIYNLKLRGSWGELGNQKIGEYPYQANLVTGSNAIFGNTVYPGIVVNTVPNQDITWETTAITDIGIDLSLFNAKLSFTVDYFDKTTRDILYNITTAGVLGLNASASNAGKVKNSGWDINMAYKEKVGDFLFEIAPHVSYVKTEVLELSDVEKDISKGLFIGEPLNAIYGYMDDGLFVNEQDIQNYPTQPYDPVPGDIKYKDISGPDGVPDGQVDPEYDRTVIGQRSPKFMYGARINASYKSFDMSITLDGASGMLRYLDNMAGRAFANKSNVQQWMWDNRWTQENPNPDAIYPRFYHHGGGRNEPYSWYSTYWAWDASYLKIRSAQIGYTLPRAITEAIKVQNMRVYLSGRNLLTIDDFFPGWDPELDVEQREGEHYPMSRTYILGLNVKF